MNFFNFLNHEHGIGGAIAAGISNWFSNTATQVADAVTVSNPSFEQPISMINPYGQIEERLSLPEENYGLVGAVATVGMAAAVAIAADFFKKPSQTVVEAHGITENPDADNTADENQPKTEEAAEAQRKAEEAAEAQRKAEEAAKAQRKAEEAAEAQRKAKEAAEAQRKAKEAEAQRKAKEAKAELEKAKAKAKADQEKIEKAKPTTEGYVEKFKSYIPGFSKNSGNTTTNVDTAKQQTVETPAVETAVVVEPVQQPVVSTRPAVAMNHRAMLGQVRR